MGNHYWNFITTLRTLILLAATSTPTTTKRTYPCLFMAKMDMRKCHILTFDLNLKIDFLVKKKVKCTLVQALRLCTGRTVHRGSRGIALLFHYHGTRRGLVVSITPRPLLIPGKDTVPIVLEAGWAPGPVWTGAENLASTGIRSPDRPSHSQFLYRLRYPAQIFGLQD
jgi:hypothetical protein